MKKVKKGKKRLIRHYLISHKEKRRARRGIVASEQAFKIFEPILYT